jgi:hypothetical protein
VGEEKKTSLFSLQNALPCLYGTDKKCNIYLNSIIQYVYVTETGHVLCEAGDEFLCITYGHFTLQGVKLKMNQKFL